MKYYFLFCNGNDVNATVFHFPDEESLGKFAISWLARNLDTIFPSKHCKKLGKYLLDGNWKKAIKEYNQLSDCGNCDWGEIKQGPEIWDENWEEYIDDFEKDLKSS